MFQQAELDPALSDEEFELNERQLRETLVQQQYALLHKSDRAVLLVVAGIDGAGKGSTINQLNEWMDPRHIHTLAFGPPSAEEAQRPAMWRYWTSLPPKGKIGVVFGSWYAPLMREASRKKPDRDRIEAIAAEIVRFEAMLAADGVQIVKLWYHLSRKAQAARTKALLADPQTAWRVSAADLEVQRKFGRLRRAGQLIIEATDTGHSPWTVVAGADANWRMACTARTVLETLSREFPAPVPRATLPTPDADAKHRLSIQQLLDKGWDKPEDYDQELASLQARLARAVRRGRFDARSLVLVFEGMDAAGKGGAIRRVTRALDARQYAVLPISAPDAVEKARPYLWRFWRNLPGHGRVAIFDRSWYGRVLVERVEKLIAPDVWQRAYGELNDFEAQLGHSGAVVLKFWLAISKQEQLRRFEERAETPFKQFKLTPDDWRNREKWDDYVTAADAMIEHTDTEHAPWHVIATDDKRLARLAILRAIVAALEKALKKRRQATG